MIKIYTKLSGGIYASEGGGQVIEHYSFKTTPRNLLIAAKKLGKHRAEMDESYGEIGSGASWMEIDGKEVDRDCERPLMDCLENYSQRFGTHTKRCADFLEDFLSGEMEKRQKKVSEEIGKEWSEKFEILKSQEA